MILGILGGIISFFYTIVLGQTEWGEKTKTVILNWRHGAGRDISFLLEQRRFSEIIKLILSQDFFLPLGLGLLAIIYSFTIGFVPGFLISWLFF